MTPSPLIWKSTFQTSWSASLLFSSSWDGMMRRSTQQRDALKYVRNSPLSWSMGSFIWFRLQLPSRWSRLPKLMKRHMLLWTSFLSETVLQGSQRRTTFLAWQKCMKTAFRWSHRQWRNTPILKECQLRKEKEAIFRSEHSTASIPWVRKSSSETPWWSISR